MKRIAAITASLIALVWWFRREPTATTYLGDIQRDDYLWSVLSGGQEHD